MAERVTIREAAQRLGVSPDTVRRRMKRGSLEAVQEPRPQGFVWMVTLPEEAAAEPPPPASASLVELEAAHLREKVEMLTAEVESRRREVSELHVLLSQAQRQLAAGTVEEEPETVRVREAPQERRPPSRRRRLTLRERVLGYVRR